MEIWGSVNYSKRSILMFFLHLHSMRKTLGKSVTNSGYVYVTQWF